MHSFYTKSVSDVPHDYNKPSKSYVKHVYLAVAGIFTFFGIYLFLTYWFFNAAYKALTNLSTSEEPLLLIGIGIASLFLGVFMIKGFFFGKIKHDSEDREIKAEDEPQLFDFLYQLADEVGAPRPYKVYLSNRVNASVFYELSLFHLFFSSKKNLEIGLGLINVMNLGEFKAVLAHEYGHFAQRSMLVGRWVYIAHQIAASIIHKRDVLDSFLRGLSTIDIRIAWVGWILSIVVWSIRSLVEFVFIVVEISQRALSREMEFQADLVAVSATGSDALIHALHKLQAADIAFADAMGIVNEQLKKEKAVKDIYTIQSNAIEKIAYVLNDNTFGKSPVVPEDAAAMFRVFSDKIAQPPQMWSTHPPDQEREANAKKHYISGDIDARSAWELFTDPKQLRIALTEDLIKTAKVETELIDEKEAIDFHNKQYNKSFLHPKYKGLYLSRYTYEDYENSDAIYVDDMSDEAFQAMINEPYPDRLVEDLENYKTLSDELAQLEALRDNLMQATGKNGIWHRGVQIRKSELPKVIKKVTAELQEAKSIVIKQDRYCRTTHLKIAEKIGGNWDNYVKSLGKLIHYCEHNSKNINDARQVLGVVLDIILADNNVSDSEMHKLIMSCFQVQNILVAIDKQAEDIVLDDAILSEIEEASWRKRLEELKLRAPTRENINNWINSIDSWVDSYNDALITLRNAALEVLLITEEKLLEMHQQNRFEEAPKAAQLDFSYDTLLPGQERKPNVKLNLWDKFISANGIVPGVMKFLVAASIVGASVGATLFVSDTITESDVRIYNGFSKEVTVEINGSSIAIAPHDYEDASFSIDENALSVKSYFSSNERVLDDFQPEIEAELGQYVYNISGAAVLHNYDVYYSATSNIAPKDIFIDNQKWIFTDADYLLVNPPESINTYNRYGSTTKEVLQAVSDVNPSLLLNALPYDSSKESIIKAHLANDEMSAETMIWIALANQMESASDLLSVRLINFPNELETIKSLMDIKGFKDEICNTYKDKAEKYPENIDLQYISCRCNDEPEQSLCFKEGAKRWTDHDWFNYAAGHVYVCENKFELAHEAFKNVYFTGSGIKESAAIATERLGRYLIAKGRQVNRFPYEDCEYLNMMLSIESNPGGEFQYQAYHNLSIGNLTNARLIAKKEPNIQDDIKILTAASDGALEAWVDNAVYLSIDNLSDASIVALAGLRLRKGIGIELLRDRLDDVAYSEHAQLIDVIYLIKEGKYEQVDEKMKKSSLEFKAYASVVSYLYDANKTPKHWKTYMKTLLFATEKPYFKA